MKAYGMKIIIKKTKAETTNNSSANVTNMVTKDWRCKVEIKTRTTIIKGPLIRERHYFAAV